MAPARWGAMGTPTPALVMGRGKGLTRPKPAHPGSLPPAPDVTCDEWSFYLLPLDDDLISMELPEFFRDYFLVSSTWLQGTRPAGLQQGQRKGSCVWGTVGAETALAHSVSQPWRLQAALPLLASPPTCSALFGPP